jgi:hypothetical protein
MLKSRVLIRLLGCAFFATSVMATRLAAATTDPNEQIVQKIYQRITGVPLLKKDPRFLEFITLSKAGNYKQIASEITKDRFFLNNTARTWATYLYTQDEDSNLGLNDFIATAMGAVVENADARTLLTGNYIYGADPRMGFGRPSPRSNLQYEALDSTTKELGNILKKFTPQ